MAARHENLWFSPSNNYNWGVDPLRSLVAEHNIRNDGERNSFYLSLMAGRGVLPYEEKGDVGNKKPDDLSRCKLVAVDDLVINSMNYGIGSYGISNYDGVCSPVYIVLRVRNIASLGFVKHLLSVPAFQRKAQSFGSGILEHRRSISWNILKNLPVPVPPLEKQQQIAEFLDRETAEIDAFIADQQLFKELTFERNAALVEHELNAVSGKELRLSRVARFKNGLDYKAVEVDAPGIPVYGSGGRFRWASKWLYDGESVLFGRKGTIDRPLYVTGRFWTVDTMYYTEIDKKRIVPKFLFYWATRIPFDLYATQTALPSMTQTDLGALKLKLPTLEKQRQIVQALDKHASQTSEMLNDVEQSIEFAKERRAALISAAVTGQIDVSDRYAAEKVYEEVESRQ